MRLELTKKPIHNLNLDLMKKSFPLPVFILACKPTQKTVIPAWVPYDETEELAKTLPTHPQEYKLIQSKILDKMRFGKT
jgi:hypothetical protein